MIGAGLGYMAHPSTPASTTPSTPTSTWPSEIPIGVLLTMSGGASTYGTRAQAVIKIAESEINSYVGTLGIPTTFKFYYEDWQTQPAVALTQLQALSARGIRVVIGGLTSGGTKAIASYADSNQIVVITGLSVAPRDQVAPAGDYIFRDSGSVQAEGAALTLALQSKGYSNVMMLSDQETYCNAIHDAFKTDWTAAGGNIASDVTYADGTKDFTVALTSLENAVAPILAAKQKVAFIANMYEDVVILLNQAVARNSPLLHLTWFGTDNYAGDNLVTQQAGTPASEVNLISVLPSAPETAKHRELDTALNASIGQLPDIYALCAYDAAWMAALAILQAGSYNATLVKNILPTVSASYWGATGNPAMGPSGDRGTMDQDVWAVVQDQWIKAGYYSSTTNTLAWLVPGF